MAIANTHLRSACTQRNGVRHSLIPRRTRARLSRARRRLTLSAPITTHEPAKVTHGYRMVRALPALQNRALVPARCHRKHDDAALSRVPGARHRHPCDAPDGRSLTPIDHVEIGRSAKVTRSIQTVAGAAAAIAPATMDSTASAPVHASKSASARSASANFLSRPRRRPGSGGKSP